MPENERRAILAGLERDNPGRGLAGLAKGKLAGRATRDRPDVPIWEYLEYLEAHPEADLDELIAVRFPVIFFGGEESTIDSAAEWLRADHEPSLKPMTLESVVDLWRRLHDAGAVRWDSKLRAIEHVLPVDVLHQVLAGWAAEQRG